MEYGMLPVAVDAADLKTDLRQRVIRRLHWMHTLRWFAAGVAFAAMLLSMAVLGLELPYAELAVALLALAASNVVYNFRIHTLEPADTPITAVNRLIYTEISTDFVVLAVLIHLTGGISNFFSFYYVFHIVIAGLLVPRRTGYVLAGAATVLVGAVALAEMSGILPHYSLAPFAPPEAYRQPGYVFHFMTVFSGLLFTMAYIASNLRTMLQRRERFLTELKDRLETWNRQVMLANERLVEIDRTKTQFMRLSGHEIRSPLSAMLSIMRTILEGYVKDEGKIIEMISIANRRANEALEITNKLLQLAREKGKDLVPEKLDMPAEIRTELSELEESAGENEVKVELLTPAAAGFTIFADKESFSLAVSNIISNAIKYSYPAGRVTVQIERWRDKGMLIVVDHGIGIPEEFMPGIYDEFSRARNARKHSPAGTGLGMSIVRQAAVNIGGSVTVRSISSQGTVVRLTVPLHDEEQESGGPAAGRDEEAGESRPASQ